MKRVDLYVLRQILRPFLFSFFIFASLWIVNLLIRVLNLAISKGIALEALFKLVLYYLPSVVVTSVPMAALMGAMLGMMHLNNNSELTALKAAGISTARIMAPLLLTGLVGSILVFFLNEKVVPVGKFLSQEVYINEITLKKPLPKIAKNLFFDGGQKFKLYVRDYASDEELMRNITLFQFTNHYPQITQAREASIENGNLWVFRDGRTLYFDSDGSTNYEVEFEKWTYPISDRYASKIHRKRDNKNPSEMSMVELDREIVKRSDKHLDTRDYKTQFYFRSAFPFASLFLILVGAPLAMRHNREGKSSGFGTSILILILYYVLLSVGKSLGGNGTLPPALANWIPNLFCLTLGIYFLRQSRV
jgi:lipopolysaccharide export system permease protein